MCPLKEKWKSEKGVIQSWAESETPPRGELIPVPVIVPSYGVVQWDEGLEMVGVGVTNSCMTALTDRGVLITSAAVIDMIIDGCGQQGRDPIALYKIRISCFHVNS